MNQWFHKTLCACACVFLYVCGVNGVKGVERKIPPTTSKAPPSLNFFFNRAQ